LAINEKYFGEVGLASNIGQRFVIETIIKVTGSNMSIERRVVTA